MSERSELRAHWTVVFAAAMGAAAGITGMSVYSLSILIGPLSEAFGWSRAEVSAAKTVLTAGFVLTGPLVGYLADRIGVRQIGIASLALLALGMFSMTLIGPSILGFYVALFLLAVAGCGTTALVWTRAVATWFDRSRGMALALTIANACRPFSAISTLRPASSSNISATKRLISSSSTSSNRAL